MNATASPIPEGIHSITPHIASRDANAAMDFYVRAFSVVDCARLPGPDSKPLHGLTQIGDSSLMLVDENPEWNMNLQLALGGTPLALHLYDADADTALAQAVKAGATLTTPVAHIFWGDRYDQARDPFGYTWSIATHIRDASPEEIQGAL